MTVGLGFSDSCWVCLFVFSGKFQSLGFVRRKIREKEKEKRRTKAGRRESCQRGVCRRLVAERHRKQTERERE